MKEQFTALRGTLPQTLIFGTLGDPTLSRCASEVGFDFFGVGYRTVIRENCARVYNRHCLPHDVDRFMKFDVCFVDHEVYSVVGARVGSFAND